MKFIDRTEYLFKEFSIYFPSLAKKTERYYQDGPNTLIARLVDGSAVWYDDNHKSMSPMPRNSEALDKDEFAFQFRRRLFKMLEDRFMTQKELAEKLEMDESQLSKYITGRTMPSFYIVDRIAKALNCSLDELRYHD